MASLTWSGYRKFAVARKETEADGVASFYLVPHNQRPLPPFKPGQYLTFRFDIPGRAKPLIRCYSVSDAPDSEQYRITVKQIPPPRDAPEAPAGLASNYLHETVAPGQLLDVMAPTGHFFLDETTDWPVVLIAGGIGLTPLLSMTNATIKQSRGREVWLFYGVRNRDEEVMANHLRGLEQEHQNFHLRIAHSDPLDDEVDGDDYHYGRRLSVELLSGELSSNNFEFYICGPSAMMSQIIADLRDWDVPEERIHFEAFGAASVQHVVAGSDGAAAEGPQELSVVFERSKKSLTWTPQIGTILDLAERNNVAIDYGCRAGNCGTCETAIRSGGVTYLSEPGAEVESGTCLACICIPKSTLVLDA
jgi:ferredoxin-NADP reductase